MARFVTPIAPKRLIFLKFSLGKISKHGTMRAVSWRDGRVAEGAPLLRAYRFIPYRGFESLSLRHFSFPLLFGKERK